MNVYQPRPVTSYGVETIEGWPVKVYGLAVSGRPDEDHVIASRDRAAAVLAAVPEQPNAAFVIAHQARPACFTLVYWWSTDVDVELRYFRAPLKQPAELEPMQPTRVGCVWEFALANHERQSWIRHMLVERPDLAGYLAAPPPEQV